MSFFPSSALPRALNMKKNPINFCPTYFTLVPNLITGGKKIFKSLDSIINILF